MEEFRSSVVVVAAAGEVVVAEFFATTSLERAWLEVRNSRAGRIPRAGRSSRRILWECASETKVEPGSCAILVAW